MKLGSLLNFGEDLMKRGISPPNSLPSLLIGIARKTRVDRRFMRSENKDNELGGQTPFQTPFL